MVEQGVDLESLLEGAGGERCLCDSTRLVLAECYLKPQPSIRDLDLSKLPADTLFYIFYNYIDEDTQLQAVNQLYHRGWRYGPDTDRWYLEGKEWRVFNWQTWNETKTAPDPGVRWLAL